MIPAFLHVYFNKSYIFKHILFIHVNARTYVVTIFNHRSIVIYFLFLTFMKVYESKLVGNFSKTVGREGVVGEIAGKV